MGKNLENILRWGEALRGPTALTWPLSPSQGTLAVAEFPENSEAGLPLLKKTAFLLALPFQVLTAEDGPPWWKGWCSCQHGAGQAHLVRAGGDFSHKDPVCSFHERASQNVQKQVVKIFFWRHLISSNNKCS